MPDIIH